MIKQRAEDRKTPRIAAASTAPVDEKLKSSYSHQATRYDERRYGDWKGKFKRQVITGILFELVRPDSSKRILDVATGTGTAALPLASRGARVTGIDLTRPMLARAQSKAQEQGARDLTLAQANARLLPFADATFDAATCLMLFHLLPRDIYGATLTEMIRVLKPGGIAVVEFANPFHGGLGELSRVLVQRRRVSYLWPWEIRGLSSDARVVRIRGSYLPLTQRIARWNPGLGQMLLNACRVFPFNRLGSELFLVLRKAEPPSRGPGGSIPREHACAEP